MITICCECGRREQNGRWKKVGDLVDTRQVSHGYCPPCLAMTLKAFHEGVSSPAWTLSQRSETLGVRF